MGNQKFNRSKDKAKKANLSEHEKKQLLMDDKKTKKKETQHRLKHKLESEANVVKDKIDEVKDKLKKNES